MFLKLRIVFCILSALCLAALLPAIVWGGWLWLGIVGGGAFLFFILMLICKQYQEEREAPPKQEQGDFLKPLDKKEEK